MIDAVTVGETMAMVRTQRMGKPLNQDPCTLAIGGAESNVAIGLARLGHRVRWVSAIGTDAFGDMIETTLRLEGIDVVVARSAARPTGLMVKSPSTGAERFVSYYRSGSAAAAMTPESVSDDLLSDAKLLHVTGITPALSEDTRQLSLDLVARARSLGLAVSMDINFRPALWTAQQASLVIRELAAHANLIFGDRAELELLLDITPASDIDLLTAVSRFGSEHVVLKRGEAGALALVEGRLFEQQAIPSTVVDTVGAGDAFVAGYLSGWLDNAGTPESLLRGAICGARACENAGDWEGSPTRADLESTKLELAS